MFLFTLSFYGKLSSILLQCSASIEFILSSMSLQSCCESNCNKGNMKSITSKNNVLLLRRSFRPEGFLVTLANHWQHLVLRPSRQRSAPALVCGCTCRARAEASRRLSTDEETITMKVTSSLLIWDLKFAFTFTSAKCFTSRRTRLPVASGKISQLLGISAEILGLLVELWPRCFQPLRASCMCAAVKPVKRTLEETER